jgi:hypothetical protein
MRITSGGNLLVGTTDGSGFTTSSTNSGVKISDGIIAVNGAGGSTAAGYFNVFDDGTILDFRKDGSAVGSIGTNSGYLYIGSEYSTDSHIAFLGSEIAPVTSTGGSRDAAIDLGAGSRRFKDLYLSGNSIINNRTYVTSGAIYDASGTGNNVGLFFGGGQVIGPRNGFGALDNAVDLGSSSYRFDDIYATNGTIQTSDVNEKQDIEELSDAEQRVAVAAKGLLRKYRWINSVEEKGDDARIHFGIIAQDLENAFTAEGLDAGRYAMFIHNEWWESEVTIPAVEEETDEDGNVITEAEPERTEIKVYSNEADAPEGAVYKERRGIRYNQLLAFIIAAI